MTKTNHELARAAAGVLWKQDRQTFESVTKIIEDAYAEAMVELDKLRRQVEFVKRESLLAIPDRRGRHEETKCLLCKGQWYVECAPRHEKDCPNAEASK